MAQKYERSRLIDFRNPHLADVIYENLVEEIIDFQNDLDENHEVGVLLASFGSSVVMNVTELGYQNPDMLYFYGFVNGNEARLIQHVNQLNFLLMSVEREDKTQPARRIGFRSSREEETGTKSLPKSEHKAESKPERKPEAKAARRTEAKAERKSARKPESGS